MNANEAIIDYAGPKLLHWYFEDPDNEERAAHIYLHALRDRKMTPQKAIAFTEKRLKDKGVL